MINHTDNYKTEFCTYIWFVSLCNISRTSNFSNFVFSPKCFASCTSFHSWHVSRSILSALSDNKAAGYLCYNTELNLMSWEAHKALSVILVAIENVLEDGCSGGIIIRDLQLHRLRYVSRMFSQTIGQHQVDDESRISINTNFGWMHWFRACVCAWVTDLGEE